MSVRICGDVNWSIHVWPNKSAGFQWNFIKEIFLDDMSIHHTFTCQIISKQSITFENWQIIDCLITLVFAFGWTISCILWRHIKDESNSISKRSELNLNGQDEVQSLLIDFIWDPEWRTTQAQQWNGLAVFISQQRANLKLTRIEYGIPSHSPNSNAVQRPKIRQFILNCQINVSNISLWWSHSDINRFN